MAKRKRSKKQELEIAKQDLVGILAAIPDPRVERGKFHKLEDILTIAACSMICLEAHFTDMEEFGLARQEWLEGFLELPSGIPSHDTFRRVFLLLDPEVFLEAFSSWTQAVREALGGGIVAIDGKALRRAVDSGEKAQVIVGAWAEQAGISLGQVKVDEKSNEITALPKLLDMLALEGCIVTIDAMGCQKEVAAKIREQGGDYLLALKGNQGNLHAQVEAYFEESFAGGNMDGQCFEESARGHGREEVRRCWVSDDLDQWLEGREQWRDLRSVAMVQSERSVKGVTTRERRFYISSLAPEADTIGRAARSHWGIENSMHWVLDVTFREDESRVRRGHAPENLALLRRWSHALIKSHDPNSKKSIRLRRVRATLDPDYLVELLGTELHA